MIRILIVRLGSLGDIIHTLPAVAALRRTFPGARLDWLVDARNRSLVDLVPVVDRRLVVGAGPVGLASALGALGRERYDIALDLQGLLKSALLARGSRADRVVGFPPTLLRERLARVFYKETVNPALVRGPHVIQKNLAAAETVGAAEGATEFPLERTDTPVARRVVADLEGPAFALLNPGAAWPNKRWPAERFGELAMRLRERHALRSVALWGPGEAALAEAAVGASDGAAFVAPKTSIADLVALARDARIIVSGDTGPLHVAAAVGTPAVGIFGPTDPARNGPWAPGDVVVSRYPSCRCHYARRCRVGRGCINDITTGEVAAAVARRLGGN